MCWFLLHFVYSLSTLLLWLFCLSCNRCAVSTVNTLHATTTPATVAQPKASRGTELLSCQQLREQEEGRNAGKVTYKNASNMNIGDSVKIKTSQEKAVTEQINNQSNRVLSEERRRITVTTRRD
jgi:hypothetical protein